MVLVRSHDEHLALLCLFWYHRYALTIGKLLTSAIKIVSVELYLEEPLCQDLEQCLAGRKSNIELAFWSIESKSAALPPSENNHCNLALANQRMTNSLKRRSVDPRQLCLISNIRCIDRVETCRTSNIAIITLGLRSFDKTVEERIHLVHVKLLTLTQELLLLVVIHVVPGVEHMALPGLLKLLSDGVHVGRPVVELGTAVL